MNKQLVIAAAMSAIAMSTFALAADVKTPSSVSESMPEMTGGQDHPTMGKKDATPSKKKSAGKTPEPSSVSESMPVMTGGQDHPTMGGKTTK